MSQLFSESRTEIILQRLLDSVARNESEIKLLQNMQNSWLTKLSNDIETLRKRVMDMEDQISCCEKKTEILNGAVRIPGTNMTIGESVVANRRAIAKTLNLVASKAESDELGKLVTQLQSDVDQKMEKLNASAAMIEKLNQAIGTIGSRCDVLSLDVQNKVDKSHFSTISSEAELVRSYSVFVQGAEKSISDIHMNIDKLQHAMTDQNDSTRNLTKRTTELESAVTKLPTEENLQSIKDNLSSMIQLVESKACEKIQQLEQRQQLSDGNISTLENDSQTLFAAHETLAKHVSKRLDDTYKKKNMDLLLEKYLQVDSFLDAIKQVVQDVESKASEASVQALESLVKKIGEEHELTRKKTDLAAQFIEWYTRNFNLEDSPAL